jgi:LEA14-like dessication related protein
MRIVTVMVVILLGVAAIACASAQRGLSAPRITVQSLEPLSSRSGQTRFRVRLMVDNQNTEPLRIRGIEFKLRLADQGIVDGSAAAPMTIEALDRQTVTLDVGSEILSSLSQLMLFVQGPENALPYEIYGEVYLARRGRQPLTFSASGEVPLVMTGER